jgi:hypothetical protein
MPVYGNLKKPKSPKLSMAAPAFPKGGKRGTVRRLPGAVEPSLYRETIEDYSDDVNAVKYSTRKNRKGVNRIQRGNSIMRGVARSRMTPRGGLSTFAEPLAYAIAGGLKTKSVGGVVKGLNAWKDMYMPSKSSGPSA